MWNRLRCLTVITTLLVSSIARADGPQTGTIDGRLTDAEAQPLRGVKVILRGPQLELSTVTGSEGSYRFALLQAGRYTVSASLDGLGSAERTVLLKAGMRWGVDLVLASGSTDEITVVSETPLVSSYDIGVTASIESEVAENLAFRSRMYAATVRLLPGVINIPATGGVPDEDMAPAMNGGNIAEVAAFVEGVDTSITRRGGELRLALPISAVSETAIHGAGFGAEYGRAISGVINTTIKTGTDQLHGVGLYVAQNTKWRGAYEDLDIPRPDHPIHSYEASLGGPIYRGKAWFFASAASISLNQLDVVPSGEVVDVSRELEPRLLKLNVHPGARHQVSLTGIDSPSDALFVPPAPPGDVYALVRMPNEQTLYTGTWSFAATDRTFLEAKASTRREDAIRADWLDHPIVPGASPDSPLGNTSVTSISTTTSATTLPQYRPAPASTSFLAIKATSRGRTSWGTTRSRLDRTTRMSHSTPSRRSVRSTADAATTSAYRAASRRRWPSGSTPRPVSLPPRVRRRRSSYRIASTSVAVSP
jgi:hypothetical protein